MCVMAMIGDVVILNVTGRRPFVMAVFVRTCRVPMPNVQRSLTIVINHRKLSAFR